MNINLKKPLVKDYDLPISLYQDPYWQHQIETLEPYFKIQEKITAQEKAFEALKENFFSFHNKLSQMVIDDIKNSTLFDKIQKLDIKNDKTPQYNRLYCPENANKNFISIDLIKANFNVLRMVEPDLFNGKETYEEYLKKFTEEEYFLNSKKIRQVIFGNLNPQRQQALQRKIISEIKEVIKEVVPEEDIMFTSSDELIFLTTKDVYNFDFKKYNSILKITPFLLKQVHKNFSFYVKESFNKVEFKQVPSYNLLEVIRYYNNQENQDLDRYFYYEGRVVKAIEPLFYLKD